MNVFHRREIRRTTLMGIGFGAIILGVFLAYKSAEPEPYWLVTILLTPLLLKHRFGKVLVVVSRCALQLVCGVATQCLKVCDSTILYLVQKLHYLE